MTTGSRTRLLITLPYWLGIAADALWAVALLAPPVFGAITGEPDFDPDLQMRQVMGIAGTLMTGWTVLLLWAVREPVARRFVILLTAFPVVFGMAVVTLAGMMRGDGAGVWILVKCAVLFVTMITSWVLAGRRR